MGAKHRLQKNGRPKIFNSELDATILAAHLANGLRRRHIIAETGWSDWQYQTAKEYLSKNPAVEAVVVETKTEPAKAEKPKPVRLTKIPVIDANLEPGKVHRFIITAAQDDTPKFEGFWTSLTTYSSALGASLITCGLTYQKGLFEDHAVDTASYDKDVTDYLITERIQLTPDLLIVCDANVLPTTANPLAG